MKSKIGKSKALPNKPLRNVRPSAGKISPVKKKPPIPKKVTQSRVSSDTNVKQVGKTQNPWHILIGWLLPIILLISFTLSVFLLFGILDFDWGKQEISFLEATLTTNPESVTDALGSVVELLVAVLGLVITVVTIVVQLAAQRYTPKLVDLFVADKINQLIFILMVFAVMFSFMVSFAVKKGFFPFWGITTVVILTMVVLSVLIPYFNYVFKFLTPINIVHSIRINAQKAVRSAIFKQRTQSIDQYQSEVANALEQISDTALSSNSQMDRNVGLMAINQIREIILDYQVVKNTLSRKWFQVSSNHFIGISDDFYQEILERKIWVEAKGFMDMELIFKMSIRNMPDAISAIAYNTRIIGETATESKDHELLNMVVEFYNTFLRISLNDKNQKAIFNLFYQYRLLTDRIFSYDSDLALKVAFYFKYYGQQAHVLGLWFILWTASSDLGILVAKAFDKRFSNLTQLLDIFLQVDDILDPEKDVLAYKGVRKSQLILASYLMSKGDRMLVQRIAEDLKTDSKENLIQLRDELLMVKDKKFWEITDRGINIEYIDNEQKNFLRQFYTEFLL